jgi:hypothetical protein
LEHKIKWIHKKALKESIISYKNKKTTMHTIRWAPSTFPGFCSGSIPSTVIPAFQQNLNFIQTSAKIESSGIPGIAWILAGIS